MTAVKVSPKYQVVIPKSIRKQLNIKPGMQLMAIAIGNMIELVPLKPIADMEGAFSGIDTEIIRDPDRPL